MNKRSKNFLNYVSVSSFDKKQEANILIRIPEDEKEIKGGFTIQLYDSSAGGVY